jgi:hypothetical protein
VNLNSPAAGFQQNIFDLTAKIKRHAKMNFRTGGTLHQASRWPRSTWTGTGSGNVEIAGQ